MKAIVQDRYGGPEILELRDIEPPAIGTGEVLIRVRASSINPADWHVIRGRPFVVRLSGYGVRRPKRAVPGTDVAGVVEAVGADVTTVRPGDEVFGFGRSAWAELATARADLLRPRPVNLDFVQAAAVPLAAVTALQGLRDAGRLQPGQRVLVIGASGGVGTFAVQIAKLMGAEVTGVCRTRKLELVSSLGADHVIDYTRDDYLGRKARYDLIFQLAGTASPLSFRRTLGRTGTLVLSSGDGHLSGIDRIVVAKAASRMTSQRLDTFLAHQDGDDLASLWAMLEAGSVRPVIDRVHPLREAAAAMRYAEAGHTQGKVIMTV